MLEIPRNRQRYLSLHFPMLIFLSFFSSHSIGFQGIRKSLVGETMHMITGPPPEYTAE
jgi:hypothetical protein